MSSFDDYDSAGRIVVGVDDSEHSRRAVDWALVEAVARGLPCLLLHAWNYGMVAVSVFPSAAFEQLADDAELVLRNEVDRARAGGAAVEGALVYGSAAAALVDASRDAEMVVVGSRGHGGLAGALLGSVSTACVHHAACPVVVVPSPERKSRPEDRAASTTAGRAEGARATGG